MWCSSLICRLVLCTRTLTLQWVCWTLLHGTWQCEFHRLSSRHDAVHSISAWFRFLGSMQMRSPSVFLFLAATINEAYYIACNTFLIMPVCFIFSLSFFIFYCFATDFFLVCLISGSPSGLSFHVVRYWQCTG